MPSTISIENLSISDRPSELQLNTGRFAIICPKPRFHIDDHSISTFDDPDPDFDLTSPHAQDQHVVLPG